jgi:hypothetical protein
LLLAAAGCEGGQAVPLTDQGSDPAAGGDADASEAAADGAGEGTAPDGASLEPGGEAGDAGDDAADEVAEDAPADAKKDLDCIPTCKDNECGDDGCGHACGWCQHGWECQSNHCVQTCFPDCEGKPEGTPDGCNGYCGQG